jgi:6-phosphogluconolactonase
MTAIEVIVHPDVDSLASAFAARLITHVIDAQVSDDSAGIVLTGGGIAALSQEAVVNNPASRAVNWEAVDFYWGDERFVPSDDPDRNELQARQAMLDKLPIDPSRVHPMPASDGAYGDDVDAAAAGYAEELAQLALEQGRISAVKAPRFDVLMLGVGPDAHIASLFPGHPATAISTHTVVPVRDSPKPPPTRISFTFPLISSAHEVWLIASGEEKAEALAHALRPSTEREKYPAAGAVGRRRTLALVDEPAASLVPETMRHRA